MLIEYGRMGASGGITGGLREQRSVMKRGYGNQKNSSTNVNIGILSSKHSNLNSSRSCCVLNADGNQKTRLGKVLERSMVGTCMLIGDGVVVSLVMLITTMLLKLAMIIIWRMPLLLVAMYFIAFFYNGRCLYECRIDRNSRQRMDTGCHILYSCLHYVRLVLTHKTDLEHYCQTRPCFIYSNIQNGLTLILGTFYIKNMRSLHKVTISQHRYLLVPKVAPQERIVVKKLGLKGVYACVIQYGNADSLNLEGDDFVSQVMDSLRMHIENSSGRLPSDLTQGQEEILELRCENYRHNSCFHV
ncbi:hypothetical protein V6N13_115754 [Hibiscus sabdariffa]